MALQLFIGVVDEQLLQAVDVEVLEPVDVKHANEPPVIAEHRTSKVTKTLRNKAGSTPGSKTTDNRGGRTK